MTWHLAAFTEDIAASGTLQPIAALADEQLFSSGDDIRVPQGLAFLLAAFALGPGASRARIVAPSLRAFANLEVAPKIIGESVTIDDPAGLLTYAFDPIPLAVGESVNFESDAGAGAGAGQTTGIIMLGAGPVASVRGAIRTIRTTASITGTENVWVSGSLAFSEDLPAGDYQIVGARCEADNPGAFRLIFVTGGPRPGSLATLGDEGSEVMGSRLGAWGVWGAFNTNQPPTLEILSLAGAGSAQVLYLDIVRAGGV